MADIYLHGPLAAKYGKRFTMAVATPAEAVRALSVQLPGFSRDIADGVYRVIRGDRRAGRHLDAGTLNLRLGPNPLHIVPVAHGSGKNGAKKAIIGIAILAAAWYMAPNMLAGGIGSMGSDAASLAAAEAAAATTNMAAAIPGLPTIFGHAITFGNVAMFGVSMAIGGIAQMFAPQTKADASQFETVDQRPSFLFSAPVNAAEQGNAVPLVYGEKIVGSVVGSAGLEAVDIAT